MTETPNLPPQGSDPPPLSFDQVRSEVERNQRNILWEDQFRNNRTVTTFLWHGDPHAKPVQRAGLIVFGIAQLMMSATFFQLWKGTDPDERPLPLLIFAALPLLIAIRFFRNAFMRAPEQNGDREEEVKP
jgi:hypothetical protein